VGSSSLLNSLILILSSSSIALIPNLNFALDMLDAS
jgi:hypothetical protein